MTLLNQASDIEHVSRARREAAARTPIVATRCNNITPDQNSSRFTKPSSCRATRLRLGIGRIGRNWFQGTRCRLPQDDAGQAQDEKTGHTSEWKELVFAQPTLIAEIEFRGWTDDGSLRHASYKGLREIQDNAAVFDIADKP